MTEGIKCNTKEEPQRLKIHKTVHILPCLVGIVIVCFSKVTGFLRETRWISTKGREEDLGSVVTRNMTEVSKFKVL